MTGRPLVAERESQQRRLGEVYAVVRPDNTKSLAVCRRLGMTALGRTSKYYETELELFSATPDSTNR